MTFQEYLNQEDPVKMPRVEVTENDLESIYQVMAIPVRIFGVVLKVHDKLYNYRIDEGSIVLWTMDDDGNKKSPSCFVYKGGLPTTNMK